MRTLKINRQRKRFWLFILIAILVNSCFRLFDADIIKERLPRMITLIMVVIYLFFNHNVKRRWVFYALILFIFRDVFYLEFEKAWGEEGYFITSAVVYLLLIAERVKFIQVDFGGRIEFLLFILLFVALSSILFVLFDITKMFLETPVEVLGFNLHGIVLIGLTLVAYIYFYSLSGRRAFFFLFAVLGFVVTDVSACLAYYGDVQPLFYLDRMAFIISVALLVEYMTNKESYEQEQGELRVLGDFKSARKLGKNKYLQV